MLGFLRVLFGCSHRHRFRERDAQGVLQLVCERCGQAVPAIARTDEERSEIAEAYRVPAPLKAKAAKRTRRARVVPMGTRRIK